MKANKYVVGTAALALMLTAGAATASAYQGDYTQKGPNCDEDRHETMEAAFDNLDYSAWYDLMDGRGRVTQVVTADNFAQFAEAHALAEAGQYDKADEIRQELGLRGKGGEPMGAGYRGGNGDGNGAGQGQGQGGGYGRGNK
jgi:hypothetical protein